jgi:hypothetical protein
MSHRLTSLLLVATLALAGQAQAQVTINPTGGAGTTDGIRTVVGPTGQLQVFLNGAGQLYSPTNQPGATTTSSMDNGVYLAVGSYVFGPQHFAVWSPATITPAEWTSVSNTLTPQADGSGTVVTRLRAVVSARTFDLTVTYAYSRPNNFVTVTHSLVVPAGNTDTVRLYHVMDSYLGGNDFGPSFFSFGPPSLVGGYKADQNIVEAWRSRSGIPWTGYFAGYYHCLFDETYCPAGQNNSVMSAVTFTNYIESTVVDNSFGIMWNFGTSPGTYVSSNDLTFYSYQPQLSKAFGATVVTATNPTTLTFTIDNVPGALAQSGFGFTDTLPAGLTLANGTATNTCGGSVTTAGGAALTTGAGSVKLTGGSMATGTTRCTLTVNVTSSTAGAYVNGPSNISGLTVLQSQVTNQTLSVILGKPVVTLAAPGIINQGNATAYAVAGTCQDSNGVVTVSVGSVTGTATCAGGIFSATVNVSALSDGSGLTVTASQTNASGVGSATATTSKDTVAPGAPTISAPTEGSFVSTSTPTLTGTAEPGTTVRVSTSTTQVCAAVTPASGTWSCVPSALADGPIAVTARATDAAGNASPDSATRNFTVDTTAPVAPVISSPTAGGTVAPLPTISGTSEPFATVTVWEGSSLVCSTTADAAGQWSCATTIGSGPHTVAARQQDRAGNQGPLSSPGRSFTVANVPTVTLDTPAPIAQANAASYPVAGACTTSAGTVTVAVGTVSTTTACTAGRFSTTVIASPLPDAAAVVVSASQTNVTGTGSDTRNTVKDTVAPSTPVITSPRAGATVGTSTPTFTGTGEAGSTVHVSSGGVDLCTAVVSPNGTWACTIAAHGDGQVTVTASAVDPVGNGSPSSAGRTITIDTQAPAAPVITAPAANASVGVEPVISGTAEAGATVSVKEGGALVCSVVADAQGHWSCTTSLGAGGHTVSANQTDLAGNASADSGPVTFTVQTQPAVHLTAPDPITGKNATSYLVSGLCTDGAGDVTISVGALTGTTPCVNGAFAVRLDTSPVPDGHVVLVQASQTTAGGSSKDTRSTSKDTTAPDAPVITTPSTDTTLTQNPPTLTGTAEPGSTVSVYFGSQLVGTTTAGTDGTWSFTVPVPLAEGSYSATATATDAAGNTSAPSGPTRFNLDSRAPTAPVIITPHKDQSLDDDQDIVVSGTAEPGSLVDVTVDGSRASTVTTAADGTWSLTLPAGSLKDGGHTVVAASHDAVGNLSGMSATVPFTVRSPESHFGGQGLGCSSSTGLSPFGFALLLLALARRKEVRP